MGSVKTLPLSSVRRITGVSYKQNKKITWHTEEIIVKNMLSMDEFVDVVRKIIGDCMSKDGDIAIELIDFSIKVNIISYYSFVELPDDINELYSIVYSSDLFTTICNSVNAAQIDSIYKTVNNMIK